MLGRFEYYTMKLHKRKQVLKRLINFGIDLILHGHIHNNVQYMIKNTKILNGGASVEGDLNSFLNMNIIDSEPDQINIFIQQIVGEGQYKEEIYNAGYYLLGYAI